MVGGEEEHKAVVNHIWGNLGGDNNKVEDVVLHPSWLLYKEQEARAHQLITTEVRRMSFELQCAHPTSIQDEVVVPTALDTGDESEEDNQDAPSAPKLRRGPSRAAKLYMEYRG